MKYAMIFMGFLIFTPTGHSQTPSASLANWKMDQVENGILPDHSGNSHHARLENATLNYGVHNRSLSLFGDRAADLPTLCEANIDSRKYSLSAWFRTDKNHSQTLFWYRDSNWFFWVKVMDHQGSITFNSSRVRSRITGYQVSFREKPVSDGIWHHIVVVNNKNNLRIYLDGGLVTTASSRHYTYGDVYPRAEETAAIGGSYPYGKHQLVDGFHGDLDEINLFSSVLSSGEVRNLYLENLNSNPVILSTPDLIALENSNYSYRVQATDPDNDPLTVHLISRPKGMNVEGDSAVNWAPTYLDTGSYNVELEVLDSRGGLARQSFKLAVNMVDDAPRFSQIPDGVALERVRWSYATKIHHPDLDDPVRYSIAMGPQGMTIDAQGLMTWVPQYFHIGIHRVLVEVRDQSGQGDMEIFFLSVGDVNEKPIILTKRLNPAIAGFPYLDTISGIDKDRHQIHWSLIQAPFGMLIDELGGLLIWNPTINDTGLHEVQIMASDGMLADIASFSLKVTQPVLAVKDKSMVANFPTVLYRAGVLRLDFKSQREKPSRLRVFKSNGTVIHSQNLAPGFSQYDTRMIDMPSTLLVWEWISNEGKARGKLTREHSW